MSKGSAFKRFSTKIFKKGKGVSGNKSGVKKFKKVKKSKSFLRKAWKNGGRAYKIIALIGMLMDLLNYTECVEEIFEILHDMGVEIDIDFDNPNASINSDNINIDNISVKDVFNRLWNSCPAFKHFIFALIGFFVTMCVILLVINSTLENSNGYLQSFIFAAWFMFTFVFPAVLTWELIHGVEDYVENMLQSNDPEDFLDDEMTELLEQSGEDIVTQITLAVTATDAAAMGTALHNCENIEEEEEEEDEMTMEEMIELAAEMLGPTVLVYVVTKFGRSSLGGRALSLGASGARAAGNLMSRITSIITGPLFKNALSKRAGKFFSKKIFGKIAKMGLKLGKALTGIGAIFFLIDIYDPMNFNSYLNNDIDGVKSYRDKLDDIILQGLLDNNIKPPIVFSLEHLKSTYDPDNLDIFSIIYKSYLQKTRVDFMKTIETNDNNSQGILYIGNKFHKFIYSFIYFESFTNIYTTFFEFIDSIKDLFKEPSEEELRCRMLKQESDNRGEVLEKSPILRDEEIMDDLLDIILDNIINKYYNEIGDNLNRIKIDNIHYSICLELFDEIKLKIEEITDLEINPEVIYNVYNVLFIQLDNKRFNSTNIDHQRNGINYDSFRNELGISALPDIITSDIFTEIRTNLREKIIELETEINSSGDIEDQKYQIAYSKSIIDLFKISKMFTHYKALSTTHRCGVTLSEEGIRLYREFIYEKIIRDEGSNSLHGNIDYNYTSNNPVNISIPTFSRYYRDYKKDSNDVVQVDGSGNKIIEMYKLPFDEPIPQLSIAEILLGKLCRHGTPAVDEILEDDRDEIPQNDDMLIMWENFKGIMRNRPSAESKHTDNIVFEADTQGVKYGESIESYNLGLCRYLNPDDFCDYEVVMNRTDIDYTVNSSGYCTPSTNSVKLLNEYDNCMFDYTRTECNAAGCHYNESSVITDGLIPIERYKNEGGVNQLLPGKIHNCELSTAMEACETVGTTILCRGGPAALHDMVDFYDRLPDSWDEFRENLAENLGETRSALDTSLLALSLASDKKLKYNIKKLGKSKSGITIYQWNYLPGLGYDTNKTYIGTTSQELLSLNMDYAVIKNGYYNKYTKEYCDMVNYSLIDVDFKTL